MGNGKEWRGAIVPWVSWLSTSVTASIGRAWTTVPSKILRRSYEAPASPACKAATITH